MDQPQHPSGLAGTAVITSLSPASTASQHRKRSFTSSQAYTSDGSVAGIRQDSQRKQHKVSRACDLCKAKKARCSGTLPCEGCTRKGVECVYDAKYSRGRPPTPPPAPSVVAVSLTGPAFTGSRHANSRASSLNVLGHARPAGAHPQSRSMSVVPAAEGEAPSRASPEVDMAEIEGQYFDPTSGLTFLHRAFKRLSSQKAEFAPHVSSGAEKHQPLMTAGDRPLDVGDGLAGLPDRDTSLESLAYYFDVCVVTYHIFHRPTVTGWLETMLLNVQQGQPLYHSLSHAKASSVMTILAIVNFRKEKIRGLNISDFDEARALRRSDPYFVAATKLTEAETGLPRLESAQARLVQVLYLLQTSRMNQGWYVFGITSQIMSALGLHRQAGRKRHSASRPARADYINSQCRKRTFWAAYIIDKYLSVVFGRPMQHRDEDIELDFPDCVNDEDMTPQGPSSTEAIEDCYVDALIFHAQISQIVGKISREVYAIKHIPKHERVAAAHRSVRELHEWRASLPPHLGTVKPSSLIPRFRRQATALKLAYCHAVMHANRPFLLGHKGADRAEGLAVTDSAAECVAAAKVALETVDGMANDGSLFHAFWWTVYVTFCAVAVIYVWEIQQNGSPDSADMLPSLGQLSGLADRCLKHLDRATSVDSPNRRYSVVLEELRLEARRQSSIARNDYPAQSLGRTNDNEVQGAFDSCPGDVVQVQSALMENAAPVPDPTNGDSSYPMQDLWNGWQTTDWLDLDSSAFGLFTDTDGSPSFWDVS